MNYLLYHHNVQQRTKNSDFALPFGIRVCENLVSRWPTPIPLMMSRSPFSENRDIGQRGYEAYGADAYHLLGSRLPLGLVPLGLGAFNLFHWHGIGGYWVRTRALFEIICVSTLCFFEDGLHLFLCSGAHWIIVVEPAHWRKRMPEFANVMREEEENTENKYGWKNKEITRNILLIAMPP